jgi:cell division protein FtsL
MTRVVMGLVLAVVVTAFYLVHTQYESRRLYSEVDRAQAQSRRLAAEPEQLQVLKRAQATPARVQQLASQRLEMRAVTPGITQYVTGFEPQAPALESRP